MRSFRKKISNENKHHCATEFRRSCSWWCCSGWAWWMREDMVADPERMQKHEDKCGQQPSEGPQAKRIYRREGDCNVSQHRRVSNTKLIYKPMYFIAPITASPQVANRQFEVFMLVFVLEINCLAEDKCLVLFWTKYRTRIIGCRANWGQQGNATMALDGWSTRDNVSVTGIFKITSSKVLLLNTVDRTGKPHTAEFPDELFMDQLEYCENN